MLSPAFPRSRRECPAAVGATIATLLSVALVAGGPELVMNMSASASTGTASSIRLLPQLRWMAARFRDPGNPGWVALDVNLRVLRTQT